MDAEVLAVLLRVHNGTFVLVKEHSAIVEALNKGLLVKYEGSNKWALTSHGTRLVTKVLEIFYAEVHGS